MELANSVISGGACPSLLSGGGNASKDRAHFCASATLSFSLVCQHVQGHGEPRSGWQLGRLVLGLVLGTSVHMVKWLKSGCVHACGLVRACAT